MSWPTASTGPCRYSGPFLPPHPKRHNDGCDDYQGSRNEQDYGGTDKPVRVDNHRSLHPRIVIVSTTTVRLKTTVGWVTARCGWASGPCTIAGRPPRPAARARSPARSRSPAVVVRVPATTGLRAARLSRSSARPGCHAAGRCPTRRAGARGRRGSTAGTSGRSRPAESSMSSTILECQRSSHRDSLPPGVGVCEPPAGDGAHGAHRETGGAAVRSQELSPRSRARACSTTCSASCAEPQPSTSTS